MFTRSLDGGRELSICRSDGMFECGHINGLFRDVARGMHIHPVNFSVVIHCNEIRAWF